LTAKESGLIGAKDKGLLDYCQSNDLVLVTADKGFGSVLTHQFSSRRCKVILMRYRLINIRQMANDLDNILKLQAEEFERNAPLLVVLSEGRYRVRK
jgi:predicted nuclease of predicted toxin-antitoxin system